MTGFPGCILWPSHEKTTKFTSAPHLFHLEGLLCTDSPPGLTHVRFIATSVACLWRMRYSTKQTLLHAFHTAQNVIRSCEQPSKWWTHAKGTRGYYGNTTYCSWSAPEFVPFRRRKLTGTKSQVDARLHESELQQDRYWIGLKSRSTRNEEQYWTTTNTHTWCDTYQRRRPLPTARDCVRGCYPQKARRHHKQEAPNVGWRRHAYAYTGSAYRFRLGCHRNQTKS